MLAEGVTDLLFKMGSEESAVFCLSGPDKCFDLPKDYLSDGVTEKVSSFSSLNLHYTFSVRFLSFLAEIVFYED